MTELPDDPRQWPNDPFALFGIDYEAGHRDLRRAYARLIRQYKPEHHPEQFRRIREAYEAIEPLLRAREAAETPQAPSGPPSRPVVPAATPSMPPATPSMPVQTPTEAASPSDAPAAAPAEADPLDVFWQMAGTPRSAEGYRELARCIAADPQQEGVYLRLYWMLVVEPELDPLRHRCEWLIEGIQRGAPADRLAWLYMEELRRDDDEALTPRCEEFLAANPSGIRLQGIVDARWRVAGRHRRWNVILRDLDRLRSRVEPADHHEWIRLVLSALDHLAWAPDAAVVHAVAGYRSELDRQPDAHFTLDAEFARYDLLWELVEGCRKLRQAPDVPAGLANLLEASWNEPAERTRFPLLALLRSLDALRGKSLALLDQVQATSRAALHQFGVLVNDLYRDYNSIALARTRPDLEKEVIGFFRGLPRLSYHAVRPLLASFCIREVITAETFLQVAMDLAARQEIAADELITQASTDAPLHYCCKAMVAFWT